MNPSHDIVLSLLETPFLRRPEVEKRQILESRPTPKISAVFSEKRVGRESSRSFQTSWYDSYKWLCGSSYKQSLYCWPCILLGKAKNSWCSKDGFKDLKNFSRSTKMHEASKEHIKNFMAVVRLEQNRATIQDALRDNARLNLILFNENVRKNRLLISYLIDVTLTLGKQELPFRGHDESLESLNRGNFKEVFKCLIKRNQDLTEHSEKFSNIFTGQSKTIQNELIFCIHEYLTDFIKNEVTDKECFFFGVMADDTTDITERSQCAITIRYVIKGCLHERFLGFFDVSENRTADALYNLLESVLEPYNFRERLVAQCYDGASVMSGELNGLQAKIKSSAPLALFTHCCAHRLNLVLQQGTKQIDKSRIFFCTLLGIPTYFHNSPKRAFVLDQIVGKRIPRSVETRWYTRSKILNLVATEWDNLILVFQTIIDDKTSGSESVNSAKGFLKHFQDFDFAILTKIYYEIFACTDLLFQILQTKILDINYCSNQIKIAAQRISELRNEDKFKEFFNWAKNKTELPTKRGKSDNELEIFSSYKMLYYEIIDCISLQLSTRFNNLHDLNFLSLVDSSKFTEYVKNFPDKSFECLLKMYPNIFEIDRLKNELSVLYRDEQFCNLDVQQILQILYNEFKIIFSETYKLFCLVLTIPATSVSVERNFSCLKRIKTYLRNTMTQERLTGLSTLAIEKGILQSVSEDPQFYEDIINKFANLKNRRIDLVYKK